MRRPNSSALQVAAVHVSRQAVGRAVGQLGGLCLGVEAVDRGYRTEDFLGGIRRVASSIKVGDEIAVEIGQGRRLDDGAPRLLRRSTSASTLSYCCWWISGPISDFSSSECPSRTAARWCLTRASNSSLTGGAPAPGRGRDTTGR